jgi:hypothetical protein
MPIREQKAAKNAKNGQADLTQVPLRREAA